MIGQMRRTGNDGCRKVMDMKEEPGWKEKANHQTGDGAWQVVKVKHCSGRSRG